MTPNTDPRELLARPNVPLELISGARGSPKNGGRGVWFLSHRPALPCLLNQTSSGSAPSLRPPPPPPHLSFRLMWGASLVRMGKGGRRWGCCQGTTAVAKQISFEPPHGKIKRPVSVSGAPPIRRRGPRRCRVS